MDAKLRNWSEKNCMQGISVVGLLLAVFMLVLLGNSQSIHIVYNRCGIKPTATEKKSESLLTAPTGHFIYYNDTRVRSTCFFIQLGKNFRLRFSLQHPAAVHRLLSRYRRF